LEAMLASRAIVGSNVDAIGEILTDGVDGLVVNPGSSEELAVALRKLERSPQLRQELGKAARKKVLEQLAPAVEKENWAKVYQQVLPKQKFKQVFL
ncbi:MAG: glycosyltransferase family 4 protein, partial [Okeania sp. SIO2F4]|uniref:glycosyltransferase n=1 Tax=Okeania sp. SIO2F4 TaxID=2607790 RepID=UPI00142C008B